MIALPDVNVLLVLVWSNHPNHVAAHEWFSREAASGWATCTLTQSGFLRLSLNPQVVQVTIDGPTAFSLLNGLVAHTTHQHIDHIPALSGPVFEEIFEKISGYRQLSDAVLLHIARMHAAQLVTFDQAIASICPWNENLLVL